MKLEHDWLDQDLPANVVLDEHVYLHSAYAFLHYRSTRPVGVRLGAHTAAYDTTMFDLGPSGVVEVGRYGLLNGPHFIANSRIVIGDYVYLSYEVYLADEPAPVSPTDPRYIRPRAQEAVEPSIVIGDDCWIGLRSVVLGGTRLGDGVIVGAGSVVRGVVAPYTIVAGNPAVPVGTVRPGEGPRTGSKPFRTRP